MPNSVEKVMRLSLVGNEVENYCGNVRFGLEKDLEKINGLGVKMCIPGPYPSPGDGGIEKSHPCKLG